MSIVICVKSKPFEPNKYSATQIVVMDESIPDDKKEMVSKALQLEIITSLLKPIAEKGGNDNDMIRCITWLAKDIFKAAVSNRRPKLIH